MKNILKATLAFILLFASWYGFMHLTQTGLEMLRFVFLVQSFVWSVVFYEWLMDCVPEEKRTSLLIVDEEWDGAEEYDNP